MDHHPGQRILVFLPDAAAALIATRLNEAGYLACVACTVPELQKALAETEYRVVVTTRPDIDTVRDIQPLPVVNLEIFFHPDPGGTSTGRRTKRFDAKAFLDRVRTLTEPAKAREEPHALHSPMPADGTGFRLWRLFRLRATPNGTQLAR